MTLVATAAGAAGAASLSPERATAHVAAPKLATVATVAPAPAGTRNDELDARARVVRQRTAIARTNAINEQRAREAAEDAEKHARREAMWDELAECETGGNWYDGGRFGGGLGIYIGTWTAYGGREFAARPQWATKQQQIEVAERIANDGYGGWGCAHELGWVN